MNYRCCTCKLEKPEDDFTPSRRRAKLPQCRACRNAWRRNRTRGIKVGWRHLGTGDLSRLEGHVPEPTVKNAVLAYVRQRDCALLLREIYRPLGLPRFQVQRVLDRARAAGVVTRFPVLARVGRPSRTSLRYIEGGAQRQMFLYQLVEGA
jgi:GNAT superfamily N-acetyltransferase